jgi:arylamine N-acetyltransferase
MPEARYTLRGRDLTVSRPGGDAETRQVHEKELGDVLAEKFGIVLDDADVGRLAAHP